MRLWVSFTILLVISFTSRTYACYFYPFGEDIRISVFNPKNFKYNRFSLYNYNYHSYFEEWNISLDNVTENEIEWQKYCKGKIALPEINKAIFKISIEECNAKSKNLFIQYLYKCKDFETIDYLKFAKEVEKIVILDSDGFWEKNNFKLEEIIQKKIDFARNKLSVVRNTTIRKRYYYQIFKLLDYSVNSNKKTMALYNEYSKQYKTQDFIDNWALYYRMNAEENDVKINFLAAQVFALGTDNKFNIQWHFNKNIPIQEVLKFAKTNQEKANIYVLYSFRNRSFNLDAIKKVIELDSKNIGLSFLFLREVNKIEDWLLTPTYTMFLPALRPDYWENSNASRLMNRVEIDRKYAQKLLETINKLNLDEVENKEFYLTVKSYLEFLTKDYKASLKTIASYEKKVVDENLKKQIEIVKALSLIANQKINNATILDEVKPIILKEFKNKNFSFLFAIAKELEFLNNKVDASYLISQITSTENDFNDNYKYWRSKSRKVTLQDDVYNDWYGYIDAELTTLDLQKVVDEMNVNSNSFDVWKKKIVKSNINRIYDLLGIKYMREDNLPKAYFYFSKLNETYYTNLLFNENPFYKIKGYMNYDPKQESNNFTKAKVVFQLMSFLNKAKNSKNVNRDVDYFLAANCYYNMTYYGNNWMLKRIYWGSNQDVTNLYDDKEYYTCSQAKKLYEKALYFTKNNKFKVLCSYMIAKCDARNNEYKYRLSSDFFWDEDYKVKEQLIEKSFKDFKFKYKEEYEEMTSICETFTNYYRNRIKSKSK